MIRCLLFYGICLSAFLAAADAQTIVLPILPIERTQVGEPERTEAEKLFREAKAAAEQGNGYEAMRLAILVLEKNPDHEAVRAILGFRLHDGCWRTSWEVDRLKKGYVDHPRFGWMPAEYVSRYEAGGRFIPQIGWVGVEEDKRVRRDMQQGWTVSSEHYDLRTNHSLEEGVRINRELEHLYRAWKLLFFNVLYDEPLLVKLFQGRPASGPPLPRHRVDVFRDKADYIEQLKGIEPNIGLSNGYYQAVMKKAYFFPVDPGMDEHEAETVRKTLLHEGTHQLFQEARPKTVVPGKRCNFWLVEGIAMFMETFRIEENRYVVGDIDDLRLYAAKRYKSEDGYYVPFNNLVRMGVNDFQTQPRLTKLYAQSAAMTHFLIFAEDERYRPGVLELLRLLYRGTDRADSLSKETERTYKRLDEEYAEFLDTVP